MRRSRPWMVVAAVLAVLVGLLVPAGVATADAPTISHDSLRTAWDPDEPGLTPASVGQTDFGRVFDAAVDGQVYAQPIVAGGTLVVATENNMVYGFDPRSSGKKLWSQSLGPAWPAATLQCGDLVPNIGVTSTPVYDPSTGSVLLLAKTNDGPDPQHPHWYMHALDARTGAEQPGFPVEIHGAPGNDPTHPFNPLTAMQRPGLLLLNGVVYAGFASHCDHTPYVGYVVGVNAATGTQTAMWSTEAGSSTAEGGIWQSGSGLVSDGPGRIMFATGNGVQPPPGPGDDPPSTLGESVVRLDVASDGSLHAGSFFSPANSAKLNQDDADLGSGGPMALPDGFGTASHPHLLVQIGKDGRVYLLDRDHLGGSAQGPGGTDDAVGVSGPFHGVWGHPAFYGGNGGYVYIVENQGPLRALAYGERDGTPLLTSVATSADTFGYTSGSPLVTSDGTAPGSAVVWVIYSAGPSGHGGQLRAYHATPRNGVLDLIDSFDIGQASKFAVPASDGNRVFVGTRDGHVYGFGRPTTDILTMPAQDFGQVAVGTPAQQTLTVTARRDVTIESLDAQPPFGVGDVPLPHAMKQGDTWDVPITFTPGTWGAVTGELTFHTADGLTPVAELHGTGTQPGVGAAPRTLDFGPVRTGATKELGVTLVNTGTEPETVTSAAGPDSGGPFSVEGLPQPGQVLQPGEQHVVSVAYAPTTGSAEGTPDSTQLTVTADAGSVTVPVSGTALSGKPQLSVTPSGVDFHTVAPGDSKTLTFDVTNSGTVPLTITKAKAPAGVFHTDSPLAEGQQLQPGATLHQSVTFTPTDTLPAEADYLVKGDDGADATLVHLAGNTTPIQDYYQQLGGSRGSYLSDPVDGVHPAPNGGRAQDFRGGSIYWSPTTGAHAVHGAILAHYNELGGPGGVLGYPVTDETGTPDGVGRYNHFNGGGGSSIYWTPDTGAHEIQGAIRDKWASLGWEQSPLGYPVTDETTTPDGIGRYNHFSGADGYSIYWSPGTGAHEIQGAIRDKWASLGWEAGVLGYPTTDEIVTPDGVGHFNHFSGAGGSSIYWTPGTGAHEVQGAIRDRWESLGWERGPMGYPTTDERGTPDGIGRYNHFTGGDGASIYWSPNTGAWSTHGAIRDRWASLGWERSSLGYPTSNEYAVPGGRANNYQHGSIQFLYSTGTTRVIRG